MSRFREVFQRGVPSALGPLPSSAMPVPKGAFKKVLRKSDFASKRVNSDGSFNWKAVLDDRASKSGTTSVGKVKEREMDARREQAAADAAAAAKYAARRVPIVGEGDIGEKKKTARRQRGSGRLSTVLSDEPLG